MKTAKGKGAARPSKESLKPVDDRLVLVSLHLSEISWCILIFYITLYLLVHQGVGFLAHFFLYRNIILISNHTYLMVHPAVTGNNVVMEHISLLFSERLESGRLPVSLGEVVHQRRRRRPRKTPTSLKDHRVLSSCSCLYLLCSFLYISPLEKWYDLFRSLW